MFGSRSRRVLVGLAAGLLMATAACSSQGGAQSASGGGTGGAAAADSPRLTFAMISHAPDGDAFFDVIKKGAQEAADKDNVDFKYSSSGEVPVQSTFIQNAIDSKVDGIAVSMPNPEALIPQITKATDAGIPVIIYNAGDRDWQKTGALSFFGEPELLAGQAAGEQLNEIGATHALCVIQQAGQIQLEDRCDGITEKFTGTTDRLDADGTDLPSFVSTVSAKLQQDPSIDAVITLGPALGVGVANSVKESGSKVKVVTYAFNKDVVPMLQSGDIAFTIDQQPWLQGYQSIDSLWAYKKNMSSLGSQVSVATGPVVVDKENIDAIIPFINEGLR